jgi:hypothetical protein
MIVAVFNFLLCIMVRRRSRKHPLTDLIARRLRRPYSVVSLVMSETFANDTQSALSANALDHAEVVRRRLPELAMGIQAQEDH